MRNILGGLIGGTGAGAAAVVVAAVVAVGVWVQSGRNQPEVTPPVTAVAAPPKAVSPATDSAEGSVDETQETAATPNIRLPAFDEVRRESDGLTVIAGTGAPGAQIEVLLDGDVVTSTTTDGQGKFAALALVPPDGAAHILTLLQNAGGAEQASDGEIILAPLDPAPVMVAEADPEPMPEPTPEQTAEQTSEPDSPQVAEQVGATSTPAPETPAETGTASAVQLAESTPEADGPDPQAAPAPPAQEATEETPLAALAATEGDKEEPAAPVLAQAATETASDKPTSPSQTAAEAPSTQEPVAQTAETIQTAEPAAPVAVLRRTAAGVELLNTESPEVMDNVALDTISYSVTGEVQLSGRAQADTAAVRVYLNNAAVINLPVDAQGRWRGEVPDVDEGIYTLRVDEVSADGKITSRVETPFKRESQAVLAAASAEQEGPVKAITVQKGATLWAIAQDRYGRGDLYVRVFEANRQDIRDPDLIYPGQIFDLPD